MQGHEISTVQFTAS